jgi:hypothetical protein
MYLPPCWEIDGYNTAIIFYLCDVGCGRIRAHFSTIYDMMQGSDCIVFVPWS